ncbi:protein SCAI-like [Dendronephthya gigantea]|uniref:protein SCAI-like n=1 Tax=Dendronephthya gigantea TaxID=151771 RepID=UPI0010690715|nr:protein SCAI-like [Dendronephthya gigantea]
MAEVEDDSNEEKSRELELNLKRESEIVAEFCNLLEQSRQWFKSLRDLPQFGHKSWQTQFGRTFDIYTKLWKFQQENRSVLDKKYKLKRWQIGEIASKIGQLYYHYYLRTSECNYLLEAFSFYTAIRSRAYYTNASKFETSDLMVKKLRYYARFIVVTLLLNKMDFVKELVKEFRQYIDEYTMIYNPTDEDDWRLVVNEVTSFCEAESLVTVMNADVTPRVLSHRLNSERPVGESERPSLSLQEIIIVGNREKQVKFSELTLDMFRMLQALEREPDEYQPYSLENSTDFTKDQMRKETVPSKRPNPHKYLLYKPTFSQLFTFLASGFKELPQNAVMLIYLSADSHKVENKHTDGPYGQGGLRMSVHKGLQPAKSTRMIQSNVNETNAIYPDDLIPFTRKAMMLIVDSETSTSFQSLSSVFGNPVVVLMSPSKVPHALQDTLRKGNVFTLFLHNPLVAFLYVCNITNIQVGLWEQCCQQLRGFEGDLIRLFTKLSKVVDISYIQMIDDEFLALMIRRFIFCYYVTRQHRAFKGVEYFPSCSPSFPPQLIENEDLRKRVLTLSSTLDVRGLFYELEDIPSVNC